MLLLVRIASIRPRHLETIDTVADAVPSIRVECQIDTPVGSVLGAGRDVLLRQPARCEHVPEFFKLVWVVSVREWELPRLCPCESCLAHGCCRFHDALDHSAWHWLRSGKDGEKLSPATRHWQQGDRTPARDHVATA